MWYSPDVEVLHNKTERLLSGAIPLHLFLALEWSIQFTTARHN